MTEKAILSEIKTLYPQLMGYTSLEDIISYADLSEDLLSVLDKNVNWFYFAVFSKINSNNIIRLSDRWLEHNLWIIVIAHQCFTPTVIRSLAHIWDSEGLWHFITRRQYANITADIIESYAYKLDLDYLVKYQKLTPELIEKYNLTIPETCWLYKDSEFKKNQISDDYEKFDTYFIAYKAIRKDWYSHHDTTFKYEIGKESESKADFNVDNDSSFGLSAWTLEKAIKFNSSGIFIKVKIHYEDVAAIVYNENKIRCTKLAVLEEVKVIL